MTHVPLYRKEDPMTTEKTTPDVDALVDESIQRALAHVRPLPADVRPAEHRPSLQAYTGPTTSELVQRLERMRQLMKEVMVRDVDYGLIPGCGEKPTLLKPGAETLLTAFQLAAIPDQETIVDLGNADEIRYRVIAPIKHIPTGLIVGHGVGECSSHEDKYKWRKAVCDEEWNEADADRRREKWAKSRGTLYRVKQVRTNKSDVANTVLKMAKKRSLIDGSLTSTGASRLFSQDLEDLPAEYREQESASSDMPPVLFLPDTPYTGTVTGYTPAVNTPKGSGQKSKPHKLTVEVEDALLEIGGFKLPRAWTPEGVKALVGHSVIVAYEQVGQYRNLKDFTLPEEHQTVEVPT